MKEVFILSDYTPFFKEITKQLEFTENRIISLPSFEKESGWHDWTTQLFRDNAISILVIPISILADNSFNTEGLKITLHIRLNYELTLSQRLTPIVLLSDFNIENILGKNNFDTDSNPQNLLFTKGIYLSSFDSEKIKKTIANAEPCLPKDYQKLVLNKLKILSKEGRTHSNTNAWGCFKLAQVTGLSNEMVKNDAISNRLKSIYSKYLICYNEAFTQEKRIDLHPIKCNGKKILFIDDQADEGWGDLMKNIFKGAGNNFVLIDSEKYKNSETKLFHDYEGFFTECRSHIGKDWDLIIIDLRLNPEKEDVDNEMISPTEFSGYKLIDEFLNENEGYQIIVSTASNKIWNINAALERGAASYYVKESPEFNYSISDTNKHYENFKKDALKCFEKSYLRKIYKDNQLLLQKLNILGTSNFLSEITNQLTLAYSLLKDAKSDVQFSYAYISLYIIVEIVNNNFVSKDLNGNWIISGSVKLNAWSRRNNIYIPYTEVEKDGEIVRVEYVTGNKPPEWQKFAGLYFQKWNLTDHNFIQQLYFLITKRNGFVHNDKGILDKTKTDLNGNNILDMAGNPIFLNHDIYNHTGYLKLFNHIKEIIDYLCTTTAHI